MPLPFLQTCTNPTPISKEVRLSAKVDRKNLCELISSKTMIMGDLLPGKPTPVLLLTRYYLLLGSGRYSPFSSQSLGRVVGKGG